MSRLLFMYLSVVIPAYNEAASLQTGGLSGLLSWLDSRPFASEVIVVDDGSQDGTAQAAASLGVRVISGRRRGKGGAILEGFKSAAGEIIVMSDMDFSAPPAEIGRLLETIESGADVAIGSRGLVRSGAPFSRRLMARAHRFLRDLVLGLPFDDTQCGLKAFRRRRLMKLLPLMQAYAPAGVGRAPDVTSGFDQELLLLCLHGALSVQEVPVRWKHRHGGAVSALRDAVRGVAALVRIRRRHGRYRLG